MKDYIIFIAIFILLLVLLPFIITVSGKSMNNQNASYAAVVQTYKYTNDDIMFKIKNSQTGKEENIRGYDFICGVVSGEMPAEFDKEALKAQAVAAFSYCCCRKDDLINTGVSVAYISNDEAKKLWGKSYEPYMTKIKAAVSEVYGNAMFYNGEIVDAYYFSTSSGNTESGKDVFNNDKPYLVSVSCPEDKTEKDYKSSASVSLSKFKSTVSNFNSKANFSGSPKNYIKNISRSKSGGIISAELCGIKVTGLELRELFSLRSANIQVKYENNKFTFDVLGYGHGVGMSQTEAQHMAKNGKTWQEILKYFYKGVEIKNYFSKTQQVNAVSKVS